MKHMLPEPIVIVQGQNLSSHCLRVVVDHTPGNLCVAAVSLYVSKVTIDEKGQQTFYFGDLPDGV